MEICSGVCHHCFDIQYFFQSAHCEGAEPEIQTFHNDVKENNYLSSQSFCFAAWRLFVVL